MGWLLDSDVDAIHDNVAGEIAALTEKETPADADLLIIEDSEDSNAKKKVQVGNLGGGAEELGDLDDVDLSTPPTDGQVLKYDNSSDSWIPADDDTGSGSLPTAAAKGDLAVYDGDSWEILTASTTDGHVLTIDTGESLGMEWAAPSGSGGGDVDPVEALFGTPDTAFEFDTTSLTGLTALGSPDTEAAHSVIPSHLYLMDDASGYAWCGRYLTIPSAPFTAITKVISNAAFNWNAAGIFISASLPGNMDALFWGTGTKEVRVERVTPSAFGSTVYDGPTSTPATMWLAIRVNSTTDVDYLWSTDGWTWRKSVDSRNPGLTLASLGLAMKSENAAGHAAGFDYLRIWDSALTFPGATA